MVFLINQFSPAQAYPIRTVSNFLENSRRYSQVKVHHRCQSYRWKTMGTISGCRYLKVKLKAKIYIFINFAFQRCQNYQKFSDWRFFSFATGVNDTGGEPWAANISANFWKNLKRPYWYTQGLGGNWFMKKSRIQKSHGTVPLRNLLQTGRLKHGISLLDIAQSRRLAQPCWHLWGICYQPIGSSTCGVSPTSPMLKWLVSDNPLFWLWLYYDSMHRKLSEKAGVLNWDGVYSDFIRIEIPATAEYLDKKSGTKYK